MTKELLSKGEREELIAKLTVFFEGLSSDVIDDIVSEAKKQVLAKSLEECRKKFIELFDNQIAKLEELGCPKAILEAFENRKDEVIAVALEMAIGEGNIPFLPIIPKSYMGIYALMQMVRHEDMIGFTNLDPSDMSDVVETPKKPYFIFDVEDGRVMLDKSPKDAAEIIGKKGRFVLIDSEVIAIAVHTEVLLHHYVEAAGTRYDSDNYNPNLCLTNYGADLNYGGFSRSADRFGAASCGKRI